VRGHATTDSLRKTWMRMGFSSSRRTRFRSTNGDGGYSSMREEGGDTARVGWRGRIWLRTLGEVVERRGGGGQEQKEKESSHNLALFGLATASAQRGGVNKGCQGGRWWRGATVVDRRQGMVEG
jgi:hypothetical protein